MNYSMYGARGPQIVPTAVGSAAGNFTVSAALDLLADVEATEWEEEQEAQMKKRGGFSATQQETPAWDPFWDPSANLESAKTQNVVSPTIYRASNERRVATAVVKPVTTVEWDPFADPADTEDVEKTEPVIMPNIGYTDKGHENVMQVPDHPSPTKTFLHPKQNTMPAYGPKKDRQLETRKPERSESQTLHTPGQQKDTSFPFGAMHTASGIESGNSMTPGLEELLARIDTEERCEDTHGETRVGYGNLVQPQQSSVSEGKANSDQIGRQAAVFADELPTAVGPPQAMVPDLDDLLARIDQEEARDETEMRIRCLEEEETNKSRECFFSLGAVPEDTTVPLGLAGAVDIAGNVGSRGTVAKLLQRANPEQLETIQQMQKEVTLDTSHWLIPTSRPDGATRKKTALKHAAMQRARGGSSSTRA